MARPNKKKSSRGRGRRPQSTQNQAERSSQNSQVAAAKEAPVKRKFAGKIRLYGDVENDGVVQISFTLPMPACDEARVAALQFAEKMNIQKASVLHMEAIDDDFSFFVVYGQCEAEVDLEQIEVPKLDHPQYGFHEINDMLGQKLDRKLVVLGACIGTDAHTVGIDAIFNMKGYLGDYGLERYSCFEAINLRAQVDVKDLADKIIEKQADVVLVSRVVTQRDSHIEEFKKLLAELSSRENVPAKLIKICGGPRMTHKEAIDIGYDAGFGPGTLPGQVASYIATEALQRFADQQD
ncbi:MAG: cobalamin B12-binding domain-containing protein [Deltaproteobacteria bacterium]|nr:cobalamin B12-binding domain-containing protein [Deltaproteobacteria bacterium]